jgi:steroid delta-isomerase-like uncharacterized protein
MGEDVDASRVIREMVASMNRHDLDACVAYYSDDAELQDPRFPDPVRGLDVVREGWRYWLHAFPDVEVRIVDLIVQDEKVAVEWTFAATHRGEYLGVPGSGQRFKVLSAAHFEVHDGKVTRDFSLFDASALRLLEKLAADGEAG